MEPDPRDARLRQLDSALTEVRGELAAQKDHNSRLIATLRDAREQIVSLKAEVDRLADPPNAYGVYVDDHDDGTVDIMANGRKMRVSVTPGVLVSDLVPGQEVLLNESLSVIAARGYEDTGEIVIF